MGKYRPSGKVIIGGQEFQTDAPIVNFREGPHWDATSEACIATDNDPNPFAKCKPAGPGKWIAYEAKHTFTARCQPRPTLRHLPDYTKWYPGYMAAYEGAKQVVRQFMIHHDGCASADMCFSVCQNERGLSCHFLCDNDGTLFQTLDLALEGWHGSELCPMSIGVELCNRGDAAKEPVYYTQRKMTRDVKPCKINNHIIKSYDFTPEQRDSMQRLGRALLRLLPNIPAEYPQSSPGQQMIDTIGFRDLVRFNGYIGHYHLTSNKWDPGPWDFKDFCQKIRGAFCWPAWPRGEPPPAKGNEPKKEQPVVPDQTSLVKEEAELLYQLNEARADGGYFPVGPWGDSRLWHGGIHVVADAGKKIFAPFPGRLVAARMGPSNPTIGSVNFVLLRHVMTLAERKLDFFTLYMHLADEQTIKDGAATWLAKAREGKDGKPLALKSGEIWLLDEAVEAGAVIGHVGIAGPEGLSKGQIHMELFSISDLFEGMKTQTWETIDGTSGGRFCDSERVNEAIDGNKDKILSREELKTFYAAGAGAATHYFVTRHVSEWTPEPAWAEALKQPKDFRKVSPAAIDQLVADQITPLLWWTEEVARHAKLPVDGVVFHYHPISFVRWLNERLIDAAASAGPAFDASKAGEVPDGITDDRDGIGMKSLDTKAEDDCNEKITLKELLQGFDAPECGQ